jgi:trans-2,3-dihydro-3-hydroxyanthranilate isomerase
MSGRRAVKFYQADVFTSTVFGGNPVAVVPEAAGLTDGEMQKIAREMNLSETVFVLPVSAPGADVRLRFFTPLQEIVFAGHPVLGAFYILAHIGVIRLIEPVTRLHQETHVGVFPVELFVHDGCIRNIFMEQPKPEFLGVIEPLRDLFEVAKAVGVPKTKITGTGLPVEIVSTGFPVIVVPVRTLTAVSAASPNIVLINGVCEQHKAQGIMLFSTVTVEEESTVHTRMFASPVGVVEDPATGSATGALGAYLVKHGVVDVGPTTEIICEQGYEIDRPSRLMVHVHSDEDEIQSVHVGGQAVVVIEGIISL